MPVPCMCVRNQVCYLYFYYPKENGHSIFPLQKYFISSLKLRLPTDALNPTSRAMFTIMHQKSPLSFTVFVVQLPNVHNFYCTRKNSNKMKQYKQSKAEPRYCPLGFYCNLPQVCKSTACLLLS